MEGPGIGLVADPGLQERGHAFLDSSSRRAGASGHGVESRRLGVSDGRCGIMRGAGLNRQGMVKVRMSKLKLRPGRGHPKRGAGW